MSEETGRVFVVPDDPADRPRKTRRASRVILIDPDDRVLLFEDSDPGLEGMRWWVTPGGGIDPGETAAQAGVREIAEETGYVLTEAELVGPVARRHVVHGYSDQILEQDEVFYLARVRAFDVDTTDHTVEEQLTILQHRWWTPADLAAGDAWIWPAELPDLCAMIDDPPAAPVELGDQEESTLPVAAAEWHDGAEGEPTGRQP